MSKQNSEKRIQEDSTDIEEFGEFQSPKIKRIPTKYVNPAPIKSPFKRKIRLDEIDDDSFKKLQEEVDGVWEKHGIIVDDSDNDIDIIEPVIEEVITKNGKQELKKTRWCFTYNNPKCTGEEFKKYLEKSGKVKLAVFQLEKGDNGTLHFQGYMETDRERTTSLQKMLGIHKCKLLYAKGTKQANHKYCTKDDTREDGPWYVGNPEDFKRKGQGARNDLDKFALVCLEEGGITTKVEEEYAGHSLRFQKHVKDYIAFKKLRDAKEKEKQYWIDMYEKEQRGEEFTGQQQRNLVLLFGPTAVGKTTYVKKEVYGNKKEDLYTKNGRTKWWCGYEGENNVLIDEFNGNEFGSIEFFNDMTNIGCFQIETKGGQSVLTAENIYIASNKHPCHWWKTGPDASIGWSDQRYRALVRRFKQVHWWNDQKELTILENPGEFQNTPEWSESNEKWVHFWKGRNRPIQEGDSSVPGEDSYFTF